MLGTTVGKLLADGIIVSEGDSDMLGAIEGKIEEEGILDIEGMLDSDGACDVLGGGEGAGPGIGANVGDGVTGDWLGLSEGFSTHTKNGAISNPTQS